MRLSIFDVTRGSRPYRLDGRSESILSGFPVAEAGLVVKKGGQKELDGNRGLIGAIPREVSHLLQVLVRQRGWGLSLWGS